MYLTIYLFLYVNTIPIREPIKTNGANLANKIAHRSSIVPTIANS
ncbi:MAG: hypothetical protein ACLTAI_02780 [Thomasclavelia sp.]